MSMTKTIQFMEFLNSMRADTGPRVVLVDDRIHAWITAVHQWLMDNLHYPEEKQIYGVSEGTCFGGPTGHSREPFSFRRYATFVHGAIVSDGKLFEFLPGAVYMYDLPGAHLINFAFPNTALDLPGSMHVHYGVPTPQQVFRQYLERGWVSLERGTNWHSNWGDPSLVPAVNGGAVRVIFTALHRIMRKAAQAHGLTGKDYWAGTKPEWFAALNETCTLAEIATMRDVRDGRRSYDATYRPLEVLYHKTLALTGDHPTAVRAEFMRHFKTAIAGILPLGELERHVRESTLANTSKPVYSGESGSDPE